MRRKHELIRNGLSAEIYLHAFVKPDNGRSIARRVYNTDKPDTSKIYPAIHSLTIQKYLKSGTGNTFRINTKTLVDELNNMLKTRGDSFTSKEKKFLELLLKKQEFVALISRGILKKMKEQRKIKQQQIEELEQQEKNASDSNYYDQNPSITRAEEPKVKKIKEKKRGLQRAIHNIDALTVISDVLGMLANSFWVQTMLGFQLNQDLKDDVTDDMIKNLNQISEKKLEEEMDKNQHVWKQVFPMIESIFKMAAKQYHFIPNIEQFVDEFLFSFSQMPYIKSFVMSKPLVEKISKLSQGQDAMQIMKMFTEIKDKASTLSETAGGEKQS